MKTRAQCLIVLVCASGVAFAQIPNPGFESWTGGNPDNWATSNAAPVYTNVTASATAHGGSTSARGDVINIGGPVNIQPVLQSGPTGEGFAISTRPAAITGWYRFTSVEADRFGVNVVLFKGGVDGTAVANAAIADPTPRADWYQFNVPFTYVSAETPDVCVIQHQIVAPLGGANPHIGSWFLLDDLAFSGTTDVAGPAGKPRTFALHQNYPNPFNPSTVISFDLPTASDVRLTVCDLLGREISTLVQERRSAGRHEVTFNAAGRPSGTYLVRFQADGITRTRSMLLLR